MNFVKQLPVRTCISFRFYFLNLFVNIKFPHDCLPIDEVKSYRTHVDGSFNYLS